MGEEGSQGPQSSKQRRSRGQGGWSGVRGLKKNGSSWKKMWSEERDGSQPASVRLSEWPQCHGD